MLDRVSLTGMPQSSVALEETASFCSWQHGSLLYHRQVFLLANQRAAALDNSDCGSPLQGRALEEWG